MSTNTGDMRLRVSRLVAAGDQIIAEDADNLNRYPEAALNVAAMLRTGALDGKIALAEFAKLPPEGAAEIFRYAMLYHAICMNAASASILDKEESE